MIQSMSRAVGDQGSSADRKSCLNSFRAKSLPRRSGRRRMIAKFILPRVLWGLLLLRKGGPRKRGWAI